MRAAVLVTGVSGTGKSSVPAEPALRGHRVVDTDDPGWTVEVADPAGGVEVVCDEPQEVLAHLETVEPLLRGGATLEIDTRAPLSEVVDRWSRSWCEGLQVSARTCARTSSAQPHDSVQPLPPWP